MLELILYTFFINLLNNTHFEYKSLRQAFGALVLFNHLDVEAGAEINHPEVLDLTGIFMQVQACPHLTRVFHRLNASAANTSGLAALCSARAGPIST